MSNKLPAWFYLTAGALLLAGIFLYASQSDREPAAPVARAATAPQHLRVLEELVVSDHESLRLIGVPDPYLPYNCVMLTDSVAKKTTMFCPDTTSGAPTQ